MNSLYRQKLDRPPTLCYPLTASYAQRVTDGRTDINAIATLQKA